MYDAAADEPHVTVHAAVVGKVELRLFLSWGIGLVVAVVGFDGDETAVTRANTEVREVDDNGQIAALVGRSQLSVDEDLLLAHDGLEVDNDLLVLHIRGHHEVLSVPAYALIVAPSAGFSGHQLYRVWRADNWPSAVVEPDGMGIFCIAYAETPAFVEVVDDAARVFQRKETGDGRGRLGVHIVTT